MSNLKLLCLPYAGGTANIYLPWKRYLNSSIQLIPLELKGRGKRIFEPFYINFQEAVEDVYSIIRSEVDNSRYALYGHSMGSVLVYEVLKKIRENHLPSPINVFFSGRYPPHIEKNYNLHALSDQEFRKVVMGYGGTPREVFDEKELLDLFVPIIRADFKMLEQREHVPDDNRYDFDITVFGGTKDSIVHLEELAQWRKYTHKNCAIYTFNGGHFFINELTEEVVNIVNQILCSYSDT